MSTIWSEQAAWSQAANLQKRRIGRVRLATLLCGGLTAVLGTASSEVASWHGTLAKILAFVAALSAGAVPLFTSRAGSQQVRDWTRLRSVSEAYKAEVYTFLAGAGPYGEPDATAELTRRIGRVRAEASDLLPHIAGAAVGGAGRALPAVHDTRTYAQVRLRGQIDSYYRPKAELMGRQVRTVRRAETALSSFAVLLGALAAGFGVERAAAWIAVVSMVSASVIAHAASSKYEYQQLEFLRTATELERLLGEWNAGEGTTREADALVDQCEQVISVLNDTWMVKWNAQE